MEQLTQQYLKSKLDFDPKKNCFLYKENHFKSKWWNNTFPGKEVNLFANGDKQYVFVNNALYEVNRLIKLWEEGDSVKIFPTSSDKFLKNELVIRKALSNLSYEELKILINSCLSGANTRAVIKDILEAERDRNRSNKKAYVIKLTKAQDLFNENNIEVNSNTGYPFHIYFNEAENLFYVKVVYSGVVHRYYGIEDLIGAITVRNLIYRDLIDAESKGVNMNHHQINITSALEEFSI